MIRFRVITPSSESKLRPQCVGPYGEPVVTSAYRLAVFLVRLDVSNGAGEDARADPGDDSARNW